MRALEGIQKSVEGVGPGQVSLSMDIPDACKLVGMSEATMRRRLKNGSDFPKPIRWGRRVRFYRAEILEYEQRMHGR